MLIVCLFVGIENESNQLPTSLTRRKSDKISAIIILGSSIKIEIGNLIFPGSSTQVLDLLNACVQKKNVKVVRLAHEIFVVDNHLVKKYNVT